MGVGINSNLPQLLKRVFGVHAWECLACKNPMHLRTIVVSAPAIVQIEASLTQG